MRGLMMDVQLTITSILEHALTNHAEQEIVSRSDGAIFRYRVGDFAKRVGRLANALVALGVKPGDRVATFGWNTHRHLELYYAVPGIGAVLHTTNIRLFPEQIAYVLDHAGDSLVFVDASLLPILEKAESGGAARRQYVVMGEGETALSPAHDYETLLRDQPETFAWPELDERCAALLCYTSATTGDPKAALYTHRSTVLHAYSAALPDAFGLCANDTVLPVVPMFHVNAWGIPYFALMVGAKLVLPGPQLDAPSVVELIRSERVTYAAGVPTVWLGVREELLRTGGAIPTLRKILSGGSAVPGALLDDFEGWGIRIIHAWGMTEMSPIGTISYVKPALAGASAAEQRAAKLSQGVFVPGVRWKILAEDGTPVARDGKAFGELWVRGPCIASAYFENEAATKAAFVDGWFRTGDICTIDELGYLRVVDRSKDFIKSGGEWISSVELENMLMGHPAIKEAAVFGVAHERWIERPVAAVVLREGGQADEPALRAWLSERVAKWMIPDRFVFVEAIPRTGVGKFLKRELRERYKDLLSGTPV